LPKQFALLLGERSTFQQTLLLTSGLGFGRPLIVTNQTHRFIAEQQLADLRIDADLMIEPVRRDSGPAIAAGCLAIARDNPSTLVLVLASDHIIQDSAAFHAAVMAGVPAAQRGCIVTFGVAPTHPEPGYGYIEPGEAVTPGVDSVVRFAEKPDVATAGCYIASGYLWNSGNFLTRADTLVEDYRRFDPGTIAALESVVEVAPDACHTIVLSAGYGRAQAQSIDYALMEKTDKAAVVPLSCGWSDIGSWDALWTIGPQDQAGNVLSGSVELIGSRNCYASSNGPLTSLVGLSDIVVVANDDAVLVADRKKSGDVKRLVEQLRRNGRSQADAHSRVHRPWGWYRVTDSGREFQVKRIHVNAGGRLSLQKHRYRSEHWVVVQGEATVTVGTRRELLRPNEHVHIPLGAVHRLENLGTDPVELVEVQNGSYLGEDDIIRLEDVYDRT
jgi:mannose-1-phosphate guanylyltransferase/mannose-6-phosphate isomerase